MCRSEVAKAVWGTTGAQKALEVLFTILTAGHRVDPEQRLQVETMEQITRLQHFKAAAGDVDEFLDKYRE